MSEFVVAKYNQFTSHYQRKKFNNKHAKSSWRHNHQEMYYKKSLRHKKKKSVNDYLNMRYDDIFSEYQQSLEDKFHFLDEHPQYILRNGKIKKLPRQNTNYKDQKHRLFTKAKNECLEYITDVFTSQWEHNYYHLSQLQFQNFTNYCDNMFLDYSNWACYTLKQLSLHNLYRTCGESYVVEKCSGFMHNALSDSYYQGLTGRYYKSTLYKNNLSNNFDYSATSQELKYIELKNFHCHSILDQIWSLGQDAIYHTLDALYTAIPSFHADICDVIIDFMAPFPQIAPNAVHTYWDYSFQKRSTLCDFDRIPFWLSRTQLAHPYKLKLDYENKDTIHWKFDDENVECKFEFDNLGIEIDDGFFKEYHVEELYHGYKPWDDADNFVMVGKLKADGDALYIYLHHEKNGVSEIILSKFWMDLWNEIESDCIKVDCYNNTKLPAPSHDYNYHVEEKEKQMDDFDTVYEYE